jgi:hypothetical protein
MFLRIKYFVVVALLAILISACGGKIPTPAPVSGKSPMATPQTGKGTKTNGQMPTAIPPSPTAVLPSPTAVPPSPTTVPSSTPTAVPALIPFILVYFSTTEPPSTAMIPLSPTVSAAITPRLSFSGKVVNKETGEWPNDRLVVLYLKGEEIGRATTSIGKKDLSGEGPTDGFFDIQFPNTYEIPSNRFDFGTLQVKSITYEPWLLDSGSQVFWLGELQAGNLYHIKVPTKNLEYAVKTFATDVTNLPAELLANGSTRLTKDGNIVLVLKTDATGQPGSSSRAIIQGVKYNVRQDTVDMPKVTIPINNCKGNSTVGQEYSHEQTFYHQYQVENSAGVQAGIPLPAGWPSLLVEFQTKYGFEQGQVDSQKASYHMQAKAGTNVLYTVTWKEVWESGSATVLVDNQAVEVPFKVRVNVIYAINSEELKCQ